MKVGFEYIESCGFNSAIEGMRYPTQTENDSIFFDENEIRFTLGPKDKDLAKRLIQKGNVHGKFQRNISAWFRITMPRYLWSELDTYMVGVTPSSSTSTMYTLKKELRLAEDYKDLIDKFSESTPEDAIEFFYMKALAMVNTYGEFKNVPIEELKAVLPEGWLQKRNKSFTYQTLRGIYEYRKDHRLPEWQAICAEIEKVPYFKELVLGED